MITLPCEQPAFRLRTFYPTADLHPRETEVEDALQARHDMQDHQLAVEMCRPIRPDLSDGQISYRIGELLDLADRVRIAEDLGAVRWLDTAVEEYAEALHRFACGSEQ